MTPSDASRVIEGLFQDHWSLCPVVYENLPARAWNEVGQPHLFDGENPFLFLEISAGHGRPITVPIGCVRRYASVLVTVLIPRDTGSRRVDDIIGELSAMLQFRTFDDPSGQIRFKELSAISRNVVIDEWTRSMVSISFEYDQEVE